MTMGSEFRLGFRRDIRIQSMTFLLLFNCFFCLLRLLWWMRIQNRGLCLLLLGLQQEFSKPPRSAKFTDSRIWDYCCSTVWSCPNWKQPNRISLFGDRNGCGRFDLNRAELRQWPCDITPTVSLSPVIREDYLLQDSCKNPPNPSFHWVIKQRRGLKTICGKGRNLQLKAMSAPVSSSSNCKISLPSSFLSHV